MLKRANEYIKENSEVILRYQIDFERKFGTVEELEKAEEKLTVYLLKKEEEMGIEAKRPARKGLKLQDKYSNQKRKHKDIEEGEEEDEPGLKKKQKTAKMTNKQPVFRDTK